MIMARYRIRKVTGLFGELQVIVRDDDAQIPEDENNTDYQNYLKWLADGNTPEEENNE